MHADTDLDDAELIICDYPAAEPALQQPASATEPVAAANAGPAPQQADADTAEGLQHALEAEARDVQLHHHVQGAALSSPCACS